MVLLQAVQTSTDVLTGLEPVIEAVSPYVLKVTVLLGGIAGVYALLLLGRLYYERKKVKILQQIRYDLDNLNMHYGIPHSRQKIGLMHKFFDWLVPSHTAGHRYDPETSNLMDNGGALDNSRKRKK